jgi:predicted kinase
MLEKRLIILRGVPGCGKSTVAELLASASNICTADDFHMKDGKYEWKPENVKAAHAWCKEKAENLMKSGASPVVIANTSTTEWEFKPYYDIAEKYGYMVFSLIVENRHGGVNIHDVPEETLEKMRNRFEIQL